MSRILLALFLFSAPLAENAPTFDEPSFERFMDVASTFERKLYGCSPDAVSFKQCVPSRGEFNAKLKAEVWRRGKQLFGGE